MAVTTTPRQLIESAYAKSMKNKPGQIASETGELLPLVIRIIRSLYAGAARINPSFFGSQLDVAFAAGGWARPETAQMIYRIEVGAGVTSLVIGTEVPVLPFDQKRVEPAKPCVFRWGQVYKPVSTSATVAPISPQNGNLTFYFSKRPTDPANIDATLDALWAGAEDFNELAILRIARYLALKDGRAEEIPGLTAEITEWAQQFVAFLEHETVNEVRSYGHIAKFNSPSLVPTISLLVGPAREQA